MRLPDHLRPDLALVICGMAAGTTSAARGHYYAGPGNKFWPTLHRIGLTPRQLRPHEDSEVVRFGIGLTDLNKVDAGRDDELSAENVDIDGFAARIASVAPRRVAFNGKKAASLILRRRSTATVDVGLQSWTVAGSETWVLPSTSGSASGYWTIAPWQALAQAVRGS